MAWTWPLMLHGSASVVGMAWTWPMMLDGMAVVVVLWRAPAEAGGAGACRRRRDSGGSGWMAGAWPRMLPRCSRIRASESSVRQEIEASSSPSLSEVESEGRDKLRLNKGSVVLDSGGSG